VDWFELTRDGDKWQAHILWLPQNSANFLASWITISFSITLLCGMRSRGMNFRAKFQLPQQQQTIRGHTHRQQIPLKCRAHRPAMSIKSLKTVFFTLTTMRSSNVILPFRQSTKTLPHDSRHKP